MGTRSLSVWSLRALLVLTVVGVSLLNAAFTVGQDAWAAVLMMGAAYLPAVLVFARLCVLYPGTGLYDMLHILFGRAGSMPLIAAMALYATAVTGLLLRNFTEFTMVIALENTPGIPLMLVIAATVLYIASRGTAVFGRWSLIVCAVIMGNILLTVLLSMNIMEPSALLPVLEHPPAAIGRDALVMGSIAIGETVMVITLFGHVKKGESPYRAYLPGVLAGIAMLLLIILRNLFILGPELVRTVKFSTYMAVRIIHIGSFLERIESSISFTLLLIGLTKMTLTLSAAAMGYAKLLRVADYRRMLLPTVLLALALCAVVFGNLFEMIDFARVYWLFAMPFQVLIPLAMWITAEVRRIREKSRAQG